MQLYVGTGSAALSRDVALQQSTDALRGLAGAALQAEGAFARLIDRVAATPVWDGAGASVGGAAGGLLQAREDLGRRLIDDVVRGNAIAADASIDIWGEFGDRMTAMFGDLFRQVTQDGEVSFASLFRSVSPLVSDLFRQIGGIDISAIVNGIGGIAGGGFGGGYGGASGGRGLGLGIETILGAGSSVLNIVAGSGSVGGSLGGLFGSGSGLLAGANPYIAAAMVAAQIIGPMLFARSPSVGPTTVARVDPVASDAVYTTDNGGDPEALIDTVDAVLDGIDRFRTRFGGTLNGNGFDIGYFPDPEDGSGQTGGYNFKAIIGAHAEDADRFRGLTEAELITEAVAFIVREGLDGIAAPEVAEAAKHSVAESLEDLFDDLVFAERFGALREALAEAGDGVDAYTVALQRQRLEIEETGRTLATDGVTAIRDFLDRVMTLFPGAPYLPALDDRAAVDASDIGSPLGAERRTLKERTLLYERDEGSGRFQPGVSGLHDDADGSLTGLRIAGQILSVAEGAGTDEGRPLQGGPLGEGEVALIDGAVHIANDALQDLIATASDLGATVAETVAESQAYLDNQDRVRDAFAIAKADVDALVEVIAGGFEPETIGPFAERLIAGTAALGQLRAELERINEDIETATGIFPDLGVAAIDVAREIEEATALLTAQLRSDYTAAVSRDLREATGLDVQDEISDLAQDHQDRRADGSAIGITDFADLDRLYREKIVDLLDGTDDLGAVLERLGGSFSDLLQIGDLLPGVLTELERSYRSDLDRDVRAARGLGVIDDVADRLSDHEDRRSVGAALGLEGLSGLDEILRAQLSDLFDQNSLSTDAIDLLRTVFADNVLVMEALSEALDLNLDAANDNAASHLSAADATRLATRELNLQVEEQDRLASTAERVIDSIADTRRRIAIDPTLSSLSPEQQLDEARGLFETLAEQAANGDQEAQLGLGAAALDYLQLARDFYASNEDYARIFSEVDRALGDTQSVAEQQLTVAQAQLQELREISRGLSGDLAGLPNANADFGLAPTRNRIIARLTGYSGDFGGGGFSAFRSGLSAEVNRVVDLLVQTIPFAAGGVMTGQGPLALNRYASGGIADTPQLALFGEGRLPEAFVPLPDGRSIPVTITEPANDRSSGGSDAEGLADLIEETRRMTAAVNGMRSDNAALRRGLERVVAASRGSGRAA